MYSFEKDYLVGSLTFQETHLFASLISIRLEECYHSHVCERNAKPGVNHLLAGEWRHRFQKNDSVRLYITQETKKKQH